MLALNTGFRSNFFCTFIQGKAQHPLLIPLEIAAWMSDNYLFSTKHPSRLLSRLNTNNLSWTDLGEFEIFIPLDFPVT